jgi:hypothetical protein
MGVKKSTKDRVAGSVDPTPSTSTSKTTKSEIGDGHIASTSGESENWVFKNLIHFWIFIPAIVYFTVVSKYVVNIPYQDDYDGVLDFLVKFKQADFAGKFATLFSQHGEHRIFSSRLLYVLDWSIFGKVSFARLITIGNMQLVAFFVVLTLFVRDALPRVWSPVMVLVGLCLFDISSYENADFALSGTVNYGILMLMILSMHLYNSDKTLRIAAGGLVQVIALYSSGAGILASLCIFSYNLLSARKRNTLVSLALLLVFAPLYFYAYQKVEGMGAVKSSFNLAYVGEFYLRLAGGHFGLYNSTLAGVLMVVALLLLVPVKWSKLQGFKVERNQVAFLCLSGYILATFATISAFRSSTNMGLQGAFQSRYLIYSHLLLGVIIILFAVKFSSKRKIFLSGLAVLALVCLVAYKGNYQYGEACMQMTRARLERYPYFYGAHKEADNEKAKAVESAACKLGIYCISDER